MKKLLYLLTAIVLFSCNSKEKKDSKKITEIAQPEELRRDLYGSWVGDFVATERDTARSNENHINKINIVIKKITEKEVIGQSIVAGNSRPLKGTMTQTGNILHFILKEPGDDKNDGVFDFKIQKDNVLIGIWIANNSRKEVTKRTFELTKKEFEYNRDAMLPEEGMYIDYQNPKIEKIKYDREENEEADNTEIENEETEVYENTSLFRVASESVIRLNASTQKLKESDLKNLKKIDLEIIRNSIFARHGLSFKTKTVRQFFDQVEWYIPISDNVNDKLTSLEKQNIAILKRFEKYAEDNYDSFGR